MGFWGVYETQRMVQIRDVRLFLVHSFFLALIFVYIVGWNFGYKKNYLQFEAPHGTIRTTLKHPSHKFAQPLEKLPYCGHDVYIGKDWHVFEQRNCKQADSKLVVYPPIEETAMLATTRMKLERSKLPGGCNPYSVDPKCVWSKGQKGEEFYIGNIEMYTLFIDHTLDAVESGIQRNSKFMKGRMLDEQGNELDPCDDYPKGQCPHYITLGEDGKADIVPLRTVLRAAGVELDNQAHPAMAIGQTRWESHRYAGLVIILRIYYDNVFSFNPYRVRYTYTATRVPKTEFKVEATEYSPDGLTRTVIDRHGIRIIFEQTGLVGSFDFQTFLINVASSLGLLAVATVIVDLLAVKFLPQKEFYEKCKFLVPVDVENYKEMQNQQNVVPEPTIISPLLSSDDKV